MALCMEVEVCGVVYMGSDTQEKIRVRVTIISKLIESGPCTASHPNWYLPHTGPGETSIIGYLYLWKMINVAFLDLFLDVSTF